MKRPVALLPSFFLIAAFACADGPADPAPELPPMRVGVVNLREVYNGFAKVKDFTDRLEAEKKAQQEELTKLEKEIKGKYDMRDPLAKDSKLRMNLTVEIVQLEAKHEFMVKMWNETVKNKLDSGVAALYNDIRDEVDAYAKEAKLTLVFKVDSGRLTDDEDMGANNKINLRGVLFHDPSYDITKPILTRLNEKYAKEKPAEPPKDGDKPGDGEKPANGDKGANGGNK
ncbi:MAG: OmpH family outer membrane protein [Planctomycetes bacterium]|nr:OmpH family outer membrane protein [Planctomycetota bacterium]